MVNQVGRQALRFGIGVILARLLSPQEFGLVAMVTVVTGFASVFSEMGFGAALIQKQNVRQEHLSSVFWLNLGTGFLLMIIIMAGAPLVADFYNEPVLMPLTMLISTSFLIGSLSIVQNTLLTKSLDFRTLSIVDIASTVLSGGIAIAVAYSGYGVWSLAILSVVGFIVTAALLWKLSEWRPDFRFSWGAIRDLFGFSASLFGTRTLNYWARNADRLFIGRFLGSNPLGVYGRAYSVMLFPLRNVSSVLSRVMFPSFSIIQKDKLRVKTWYLRMTRAIALVTFPLMLGLFVTVEPFVLAVFGGKWAEMIPILRIFSLLGLTQSIITLIGNLYLSQGRADLQFKVGLLLKANVILAIILGLRWGVVGVASTYAIASLINSYPNLFFAGRLVDLSPFEVIRTLSGIFACAAAMAAIVWALGFLLPLDWPHWAYLAVQVPIGAAVYGALVHFLRLHAYRDVRELIREQLERQFRAATVEVRP